jgi:hypothetical protein
VTDIDLFRINQKIRRRFGPDYWRDDRSTQCFRQVWGWPETNGVGVFTNTEEIRFELKGKKQWNAEIEIAVAPNGWHTFSTHYWYGLGGGGYAPSVSTDTAYTTRAEAMDAALDKLMDLFEKLRISQRPDTADQADNAEKMIRLLEASLSTVPTRPRLEADTPQLSLFA